MPRLRALRWGGAAAPQTLWGCWGIAAILRRIERMWWEGGIENRGGGGLGKGGWLNWVGFHPCTASGSMVGSSHPRCYTMCPWHARALSSMLLLESRMLAQMDFRNIPPPSPPCTLQRAAGSLHTATITTISAGSRTTAGAGELLAAEQAGAAPPSSSPPRRALGQIKCGKNPSWSC